ncbi:FAD-linked oxidase C-terminal domain-containing protein [Granulosicoccus antarcticus]|uniref:Putative FAD-linked oxidoreductase n=1 Tax=Granulosicoccus antarcticus IMCC3135 TaxID=1192854 RepID=A0A2Z2NNB8_9GAMM|nr:FAD-linked oxidase C-terminal domain-containing protein [Granulosicoccus antarcticus]ASJ72962.1 putative FAD-linked oxidoreductase [Granulosicoccus antarcticus IMCC3135]
MSANPAAPPGEPDPAIAPAALSEMTSGQSPQDNDADQTRLRADRLVRRKRFALELQQLLPAGSILSDQEQLRPYESDGLTALKATPLLVVLPETIEQVQAVICWARDNSVPVVARGAGTGLSGGALPHEDGLLLGLAKFNRILETNQELGFARVQPGVRNLSISDAARPLGLYYAPDPSSQIACTIGGNVAENSGGVHCLKYGLTVHNVLSVTMVTIDGELVVLGSDGHDSAGYDLLALFTGSEGMLGVVVEVRVKLLPVPPVAKLVMAAFASVESAGDAVGRVIAEGIIPAGLELMDNPAIVASEAFAKCGYPTDAAALLLCELDGMAEEVESQIERVSQVFTECSASSLHIAASEAERLQLWKGRKAAFPAVGRLAPDYYCIDGTIPRKQLSHVLQRMEEMSAEYGLPIANVFHAGDGNLHPLIMFDAGIPGELHKTEELGSKILQLCVEVGGSITGEHGVGMEKINEMCVQFDADTLTQFHSVKAAFDPEGLLNPGKAVPTLQRCAEFGAMHIHHGELPFPELERF